MSKYFLHNIVISKINEKLESGFSIVSNISESFVLEEDDEKFWDLILDILFEDLKIKKEHWQDEDFLVVCHGSSFNEDDIRNELNNFAMDNGDSVEVCTLNSDTMFAKVFKKGYLK